MRRPSKVTVWMASRPYPQRMVDTVLDLMPRPIKPPETMMTISK